MKRRTPAHSNSHECASLNRQRHRALGVGQPAPSRSWLMGTLLFGSICLLAPPALYAQQVNLADGNTFYWDLVSNEGVLNGTFNATDGYPFLEVGGTVFPFLSEGATLELGGRQVVYGPVSIGGLNVSRRMYVPVNSGWGRFLEVFENPTGSAR